jgi:hypothetical protein
MTESQGVDRIPYEGADGIDFSIITMRMRCLPLLVDDLFLGMQAMNVGLVDSIVTDYEYDLLNEYLEIERTPGQLAMTVSAMSQMWVYGLYEVLRMWRDRIYHFRELHRTGGIVSKLKDMPADDPYNFTIETRKLQLKRYNEDPAYREIIEEAWSRIEPVYRMVELFRMNLAKHCAPGKDGVMPQAPGYGRINMLCGAMDFELVDKVGSYYLMNRRDIADKLRRALSSG